MQTRKMAEGKELETLRREQKGEAGLLEADRAAMGSESASASRISAVYFFCGISAMVVLLPIRLV